MWPHELKLRRAAQHFDELKAEVWRWEDGHGYSLLIEPDSKPPNYVVRAELVRPIEEDPLSFLIGDFLQNARSALDYLACALGDAGAGGLMDEDAATNTMFPIVGGTDLQGRVWGSPAIFRERVRRRLATVSEPARAAIERLQPYKTGGDLWAAEPLWVLNELARFDRHRFLHLGIARAGGFRMNPDASRNVRLTDLVVEAGTFRVLEGVAAEEAAEDIAMGIRPKDGAVLARFTAEPVNARQEMKMDFEGALEITFDVDRLPESVFWRLEGESIVSAFWFVVPTIQEVFDALSPHLPDEPPIW